VKLILTEAALEDLRSIRAYTLEKWGEEMEERYLRKLWTRIESLRVDPCRYRIRKEFFPGCRLAAEGRHLILFRSGDQALEIVRILHSAMDLRGHLPHGAS